jgi:hypothetical protein
MNTGAELTAWRRGFALPDRRPITEWAREHVKLGGGYARQGSFDVSTCRHLEAPLLAVQDESVREVTCRAAIQTMKTLLVEVSSLWAIANEPGPIMWTQQDDDSAKEHVKGRYRGLMRACEPVSRLLPRAKHDANTLEIYFGDFYLLVNGANLNNLQSKSIRWKFNSECWLWKQGLLTHARRRVSAFARDGISKIVNESQGSFSGDDFDQLWDAGTRQQWSVPCAGCGAVEPLVFFARMRSDEKRMAGVVWSQDAEQSAGKWDEARVRESVRWVCPTCGHEHANTGAQRAKWNKAGVYSAPRAGADLRHRSFEWNALLAEDMGQLAVEFLTACEHKKRGVLQPLKDFYMQRLALSWREESLDSAKVEAMPLSAYTLAEVAQSAPVARIENEAARFLTVDRQRDHFFAVVRAWRTDGTSRLLWRGKLLTPDQIEDVRARFYVEAQLVFQDAQYSTAHVYEDCVRYGWTALHGSGDDGFTKTLRTGKKVTRYYSGIRETQVPGGVARYMFWASDPVKDMLSALSTAHSYQWEVPADVGEDYVRQMRGEVKRERVNKTTGRSEWRWTKVGPNHFWDCEAMQVAAALALQILPSPDREDTETPAAES